MALPSAFTCQVSSCGQSKPAGRRSQVLASRKQRAGHQQCLLQSPSRARHWGHEDTASSIAGFKEKDMSAARAVGIAGGETGYKAQEGCLKEAEAGSVQRGHVRNSCREERRALGKRLHMQGTGSRAARATVRAADGELHGGGKSPCALEAVLQSGGSHMGPWTALKLGSNGKM